MANCQRLGLGKAKCFAKVCVQLWVELVRITIREALHKLLLNYAFLHSIYIPYMRLYLLLGVSAGLGNHKVCSYRTLAFTDT